VCKKGDDKSGGSKGENKGAGGKERKGKEREEELVVRFYLVLFGEAKRRVWQYPSFLGFQVIGRYKHIFII
jgi:hypothetical protein